MKNVRMYDDGILEKLQKIELDMFKDFALLCDKHNINYFAIAGSAIGAVRHGGMIPWDDDIDIGMLREDYEKLLKIVPEYLDKKYRFNGPDSDYKYYNLVPNISRIGTRFVIDLAEGTFDIGIFMDIFVFENISNDKKEVDRQIWQTRIWRNLYVLSNINYFRFLNGEPFFKKVKYVLCGTVHYILKVIPCRERWLYRHYLKYALKYNGQTDHYTILGDPFAKILCLKREDIFPLREAVFGDTKIKIPNHCEKMLEKRFGNYMEIPPEEERVNHCPVILEFGEVE